VVASPDGVNIIRGRRQGPCVEAERIGAELGREMLDRGGRQILESVYGADVPDVRLT
jgi:hydroxymethylbilane synthase